MPTGWSICFWRQHPDRRCSFPPGASTQTESLLSKWKISSAKLWPKTRCSGKSTIAPVADTTALRAKAYLRQRDAQSTYHPFQRSDTSANSSLR